MKKSARNKFKYILCLALIIAILCTFTGCFDLGNFQGDDNDQTDYYSAFGEVKGYYAIDDLGISVPQSKDYDIEESLYNKTTVNDLDWEDEDYIVDQQEYLYIKIPIKRAMEIDSLALYVKGDKTINLEINLFHYPVGTPKPLLFRYLHSPVIRMVEKEVDDPDHPGEKIKKLVEEPIIYDDPPVEDAIATKYSEFSEGKWTSFLIEEFVTGDTYELGEDDELYLRIENNSGARASEEINCSFQFLNLLIRAE